jgi:hypothetical protein
MISHARSTFHIHFHFPVRSNQIADVPIVPKDHEQRKNICGRTLCIESQPVQLTVTQRG